jgi:hypothetical protein
VDVTQHLARLSEALGTLLVPHHLRDHPQATSLPRSGATVTLVAFGCCQGSASRRLWGWAGVGIWFFLFIAFQIIAIWNGCACRKSNQDVLMAQTSVMWAKWSMLPR